MALSFILEEGIATELAYPLVGNLPLVGGTVRMTATGSFNV
jgi:hypothetical protein